MKMPPEYFTCPFNTSTDGSGGTESENEKREERGNEGKAAVHVDAGTGGEAKVP